MYYNIFVHIYQLLHRALLLKYGNKKALENASNALLVELEGIAPSSASLSWLGFYRHRLFECLRNMAGK